MRLIFWKRLIASVLLFITHYHHHNTHRVYSLQLLKLNNKKKKQEWKGEWEWERKGASVWAHVQSKICVRAIDIDPAQLTKPNDKRKLLGIFYLMIIINNKKFDVVEGREKIFCGMGSNCERRRGVDCIKSNKVTNKFWLRVEDIVLDLLE